MLFKFFDRLDPNIVSQGLRNVVLSRQKIFSGTTFTYTLRLRFYLTF